MLRALPRMCDANTNILRNFFAQLAVPSVSAAVLSGARAGLWIVAVAFENGYRTMGAMEERH